MRRISWLVLLLGLLALAVPAQAAQLRVGGEEYESLTLAVAAANPGDTLVLAPGVYDGQRETFPIVLDKALTLVGEDGAVVQGGPFETVFEVCADGVVMQNLDVRLLRWGILCTADEMTLEQCRFTLYDDTYRVSSCGVWLAGAYDCTVKDCAFTGCGLSIAGPPLTERSAQMPILTGLFEVGEDVRLFTSHCIENNTINDRPLYYIIGEKDVTVPEDAGGLIAADCENLTISNVHVADSSMGLEAVHCKNVQVVDSTADRCGLFGIYLAYLDGGVMKRVQVTQTNHGLDLRNVHRLALSDCATLDCEQGVFYSWAYDCVTRNCDIVGCGNGFFAASGEHNLLMNSRIADNENGIHLQHDQQLTILNNDITGNTVVGVRLYDSGPICADNRLHDNWVGIIVASGEHIAIADNAFENNASAGLYVHELSDARITGNTFGGETRAHIEADGAVEGCMLIDNVFEGEETLILNEAQPPLDLSMNTWM